MATIKDDVEIVRGILEKLETAEKRDALYVQLMISHDLKMSS